MCVRVSDCIYLPSLTAHTLTFRLMCDQVCASTPVCVFMGLFHMSRLKLWPLIVFLLGQSVSCLGPVVAMATHSHDSSVTWATSQAGQVTVTMWMIQAAGVCGGRTRRQNVSKREETRAKFKQRKRERELLERPGAKEWLCEVETKRKPSWRKKRRLRPRRPRWTRTMGRSLTSLWQTTQVKPQGTVQQLFWSFFFKVSHFCPSFFTCTNQTAVS